MNVARSPKWSMKLGQDKWLTYEGSRLRSRSRSKLLSASTSTKISTLIIIITKKKEKKKKRYIKIESYWISAVVSTVLSSSIIVTINIDRSFKVTSYSNNTSPLPSNDTICVIINYCLQKRTSNTSMRLFKQVTSDFVMQDISFMMWSTSKCFL